MALILDDCIRSTASNPLPDSLVHSYNKHCFQNFEVAEETLTNKVLLPGEVAFAYYYDLLSPYGQTAVFAVGPLVHGSGNTIFKNSLLIDALRDDLLNTIVDVNSSINYLKEDLAQDLDTAINHLDSSINEIWDLFINTSSIYNTAINTVFDILYTGDTSIMNVVNSSYTELKDLITYNQTELTTLINDVSNNLYAKIEDTSNYIVNYIVGKINEGFGGVSDDTNNKIDGVSLTLSDIIDSFKNEINNKVDTVNDNLLIEINSINHKYAEMQMAIDTIKRAYEEMYHTFVHMDNVQDISTLLYRISSLEAKVDELINK